MADIFRPGEYLHLSESDKTFVEGLGVGMAVGGLIAGDIWLAGLGGLALFLGATA